MDGLEVSKGGDHHLDETCRGRERGRRWGGEGEGERGKRSGREGEGDGAHLQVS